MKNLYFITFYSLLILFIGCSEERIQNDIQENNQSKASENTYQTDLIAGQNTDSGNIIVSVIDGNLNVTYETEGDWVILEVHLFVGDPDDLPVNNGGNPKIGQFPYSESYSPGETSVTFNNIIEIPSGESVWIAAHAVVLNTVTGQEETAWAAGVPINSGGNGNGGNGNGNGGSWAMWFEVSNNGGGGGGQF
tara:strand:- start:3553 stop:4128 length:576 start_codon:yes stop_codon:yes gene_type:complete